MKNPAYELIAQAYKIPYELVYQRENLSAAVERLLNTPGAYILECVILDDDDILPMTPPGCDIGDMLLEIHV